MFALQTVSATRWVKCSCCSEQIRTCEQVAQVVNLSTGKVARGGSFCTDCAERGYPSENFDLSSPGPDEDSGLRDREAYAAYQAAGCTEHFFTDAAEGYV